MTSDVCVQQVVYLYMCIPFYIKEVYYPKSSWLKHTIFISSIDYNYLFIYFRDF